MWLVQDVGERGKGRGGTGYDGIARIEGWTREVNVLYKSIGRW